MRYARPADPDRVDQHADDGPGKAAAVRLRVVEQASERRRYRVSITLGMRPVPVPGGADDGVEVGEPRRPVQFRLRFLRRGVQDRRIARPARRERPRHLPPGHALHRVDDLPHRVRAARAEVVGAGLARFRRSLRARGRGRRRDRSRARSRADRCRRASDSRRQTPERRGRPWPPRSPGESDGFPASDPRQFRRPDRHRPR